MMPTSLLCEQVLFNRVFSVDEERNMPLTPLFEQLLFETVLLLDVSREMPSKLDEQVLLTIAPCVALNNRIPAIPAY